jgi:hypothetical protein
LPVPFGGGCHPLGLTQGETGLRDDIESGGSGGHATRVPLEKVLVVEPGSFRTGFAGGGALRQTAAIPAYEESVGAVRTNLPGSDGKQEGDPDKAAAAILAAPAAERTPLRLPAGNDAADAVFAALDAARAETVAWEKVSRSTGFDN